jgi:hypothetical protein
MSYARGFGQNGTKLNTNVTILQACYLNFIVDSTNGNGLGIRSLKSNGYVESVFMNTSATPGTVANITNPNPLAGYALMRFKNNFRYYLGGFSGQVPPLTSTSTTALTAGHVYVITSVGTTTLAQWLAVGLFPGINSTASSTGSTPAVQTPTVGMTFVATVTASISGTGTVGVPGVMVAPFVSVVGDPNQAITNTSLATYAGAQVMVQFSGPTSGTNTALIPTAPANGTVIGMRFDFDASTTTIDGI